MVCSAGNDATSRPCFPAAFAPWSDGAGPVPTGRRRRCRSCPSARSTRTAAPTRCSATPARGCARYVPGCRGDEHDARRSRVGSSRGPDQGVRPSCASPSTRTTSAAGFGVWSGTSFAAPLLAGRLAATAAVRASPTGDDAATAVARAWQAVEALTSITPIMRRVLSAEELHRRGVAAINAGGCRAADRALCSSAAATAGRRRSGPGSRPAWPTSPPRRVTRGGAGPVRPGARATRRSPEPTRGVLLSQPACC